MHIVINPRFAVAKSARNKTPRLILFALMLFLISACHKEDDLTGEDSTITIDGWEITKRTNTINIYTMFDMFFLNPQTGFVIDYDGSIYKTTDSCKTWRLILLS